MDYFIIGDEDTVLGFELAGVSGKAVKTPSEALASFNGALQNKEHGILIITENTADMIREVVDRYLFSAQFPLIVEIPGSRGRKEGRRDLRTLVNEAIGIKL